MSSAALYLLLASPLFLFTIWHFASSISPPPIPDNLTNKRIILLIAHPDDESMFFSPTVQTLTKPELGNHVKILCLSTGDSEGLGEIRKKELEKAAVTLGLRRREDVFVMHDQRFKDGMKEEWDEKEIARVLAQAFAPQLIPTSTSQHARTVSGVDLDTKHRRSSSHFNKSAMTNPTESSTPTLNVARPKTPNDLRESVPSHSDGPRASIDVLLTFDESGISGHPNHKSLYHGSKVFLQQVMKGYAGYECPIGFYTLTTTNLVRKYSFILDVVPTYLVNIISSILGSSTSSKTGTKAQQTSKDDKVIFVSDVSRYLTAREAMVRGHESQMVWFRWGWISLGRYMVVNDLKREYVHGS